MYLRKKELRRPLWFGTGWHFTLEDFHGNTLYSSPRDAWRDYVRATFEYYGEDDMPDNWRDLADLGEGMADYYVEWLKGRDPLETWIIDGVPQCEVNFRIPLPVSQATLDRFGVDVVYYNGTLDRVIVDQFGSLAIGEYKTAASIYQGHYLIDPQITAYSWGAQILYDQPIDGVYYYQFRKGTPEEPAILRSGLVSTNKQASTTYLLYKQVLKRIYGDVEKAPQNNIDHLNYLAGIESPSGDKFIQRDYIARNQHSLQSESIKIMLEVEDMLNPDLALYNNPTRECTQFGCDFLEPCIAVDDGDDWESLLQGDYVERTEEAKDPWRQYLKHHKPCKELSLTNPPETLLRAALTASEIRQDPQEWLHSEHTKRKLELGLTND